MAWCITLSSVGTRLLLLNYSNVTSQRRVLRNYLSMTAGVLVRLVLTFTEKRLRLWNMTVRTALNDMYVMKSASNICYSHTTSKHHFRPIQCCHWQHAKGTCLGLALEYVTRLIFFVWLNVFSSSVFREWYCNVDGIVKFQWISYTTSKSYRYFFSTNLLFNSNDISFRSYFVLSLY